MLIEKAINPVELCEFKFDESEWTFEGYGSVFDSIDMSGDTVKHGAFAGAVKAGPAAILMRYEHLRHTTPGKYVHMEEDSKGLFVKGELTKGHSVAADMRASFQHGTVKGLSIGFIPSRSVIEQKEEGGGRNLKTIWLKEISVTADPMEPQAIVTGFKSEIETIDSIRDAEIFLREAGELSRTEAKALIGRFREVFQRDADEESQKQIQELRAMMQLKGMLDRHDLRKLLN